MKKIIDARIDLKKLTLDQVRKLRWISLPDWIDTIINVNTYYRIKDKKHKYWPQDESIKKLREAFWVDEETFLIILENQWKKDEEKKNYK